MPRYVLTYRGEAVSAPPAEIKQIAAVGKIVDQDARVVLLDADDELNPARLAETLQSNWSIEPERFFPVPDTRKKIQKPAVD
jgi:hypothetical protein